MEVEAWARALVGGGGEAGNLVAVPSLPSTNRLARRIGAEYLADDQPVPALAVAAWEQTAGRGSWGRSWASPPGRGVYASLLLAVADAAELATLPLLTAVGLAREVDRRLAAAGCTGCSRLKWPNDLMVGGRKLAGILIETVAGEGDGARAAVIGFGLNVDQDETDLASVVVAGGPGATSLRVETGGAPPLAELTRELVAGVRREVERRGDPAYAAAAYRERSLHVPGEPLRCRTGDGVIEGIFLGFDPRGSLRLSVAGEERRVAAGEVIGR